MATDKKKRKAAALKYDPKKDMAPMIAAAGQGTVAEKIIEKAAENKVPIVQDDSLAELLASLSVGDAIPRTLYEAVAQVLIYVSQKDANYNRKLRF